MNAAKVINLIVIILLVAFIWGNSCLGREESAKESGYVYEHIVKPVQEAIFKKEILSHEALRKCAHAFEFMCLGIAVMLFFRKYWLSWGLCILVAAADETIQIFTGRGSAVRDVMIDSAGALFGVLAVYICIRLTKKNAS